MTGSPPVRPRRKQPNRYHHGDLRRALVQEAVRTIGLHSVENLTLRAVGQRLRVSRTALYRHFSDKKALLAEVAHEGFRMLREDLLEAWESSGRGPKGFDAMGRAYVHFALTHPSHYRVMFGGYVDSAPKETPPRNEAVNAFQVLVNALVEQQQAGLVRPDDPLQLARYIWSIVHGIAMLAIDGLLPDADGGGEGLFAYAADRIRHGISASSASGR